MPHHHPDRYTFHTVVETPEGRSYVNPAHIGFAAVTPGSDSARPAPLPVGARAQDQIASHEDAL